MVKLEAFMTMEDQFGRFRIYRRRPASEHKNLPLLDHNDFAGTGETFQPRQGDVAAGLRMPAALIGALSDMKDFLGVFVNASITLLIGWFYSGTKKKSIADAQDLVNSVILNKDFNIKDLRGVRLARELKRIN